MTHVEGADTRDAGPLPNGHERSAGSTFNSESTQREQAAGPSVRVSTEASHRRSKRRKKDERALAIYSGRDRIGHIEMDGDDHIAFDLNGRRLGPFGDQISASYAIGVAAKKGSVVPASCDDGG